MQKIWTDPRLEVCRERLEQGKHSAIGELMKWAGDEWCNGRTPDDRTFKRRYLEKFGVAAGSSLTVKAVKSAEVADAEARLWKAKAGKLQEQLLEHRERERFDARVMSFLGVTMNREPQIPAWVVEREIGMRHGVPSLMLSDWHDSEVVRGEEIGGINEYNLQIAEARAERVFRRAVKYLEGMFTGAQYPGVVVPIAGDMVAGIIHDELRETNEIRILESAVHVLDLLKAGLLLLHGRFGRIFVPCVVGNHGRLDRKPRAKGAVADNVEWLVYTFLKRELEAATGGEIHVDVSPSLHRLYRVQGFRYLLHHGDVFRGGSGMAGPLLPWSLGSHKLRAQAGAIKAALGIDSGFDYNIFGHWHRFDCLYSAACISNGSLKGFDEYAKKMNFIFERPRQALWFTHPDHGITITMPVYADPRKRTEAEASPAWVEWQAA